ncbi:MAG: hypothetical protein IPM17_09760 [Verrucomicrobia bacterium]|nr:hypothetical protein [Verrucomicrobiota bacterium]
MFFAEDGSPRPEEQRGFDAVLGNPLYVTRQTMSGQPWLALADARLGYAQDTYECFTRLSFRLLRPGGRIGFITADTFFTLENFTTLRELLQSHELTHLGQCDPFDATVDAALFVARKSSADFQSAVSRVSNPPSVASIAASCRLEVGDTADWKSALRDNSALPEQTLLFIQARPRNAHDGRKPRPDKWLNRLPYAQDLPALATTPLPNALGTATHAQLGSPDAPDTLRVHRVPVALYRAAHKSAFFEPRPGTLRLFARFNDPVKRLVAEWWPRIETSEKFADNAEAIHAYQDSLRHGDVTLVGLVAQGGQGLATANNARFLGYLAGTPQARDILARREAWTQRWLANPKIKPVFLNLLAEHGGDPAHPTRNSVLGSLCRTAPATVRRPGTRLRKDQPLPHRARRTGRGRRRLPVRLAAAQGGTADPLEQPREPGGLLVGRPRRERIPPLRPQVEQREDSLRRRFLPALSGTPALGG